ncbi:hypothetical protein BV22DRAFT_762892 [Leucogyrophana mollusca]|uniref:Uncharacterized protein n=1 Tax=Leucogyrophana mollusca TaxID=85980 RepID=A0ACB8B5N6_9AGAM|nr:hypothetical protein BV22DRAFT_762892 [Leucogyrophana mollusca]
MARLRRDTITAAPSKTLRIFSTGTIFNAYTLTLPTHPTPATASRAHAVHSVRGGSAGKILALLAEFGHDVEPMLIASLGDNDDAVRLRDELENQGISTRYCKIWEGKGVPCAWVMHALDTNTRSVINHNPLPDISHEDFIALLGPLLAPENYAHVAPAQPSPATQSQPRVSQSGSRPHSSSGRPHSNSSPPTPNPASPAPFDWLHFEARSVKATLANILGVDGLARERKWRSHCVFSVDLGRRAKEGVEVLIPHADVIFVSQPPTQPPTSPRALLLSLARLAPPHALLIAHCGREGAALLSVPTRDYLQSSGWAPPSPKGNVNVNGGANGNGHSHGYTGLGAEDGVESVRSGSDFWAGRSHSPDSSGYTATHRERNSGYSSEPGHSPSPSQPSVDVSAHSEGDVFSHGERNGHDHNERNGNGANQGSRIGGLQGIGNGNHVHGQVQAQEEDSLDEEGAQDAFVAGMMYSLSRRLLPGPPYSPEANASVGGGTSGGDGKWRLDECLRFATELAGRKARGRGKGWEDLVEEMRRAGWFE